MIYASTKEQLRRFLDVKASIHADDLDELEWKTVLKEVSVARPEPRWSRELRISIVII